MGGEPAGSTWQVLGKYASAGVNRTEAGVGRAQGLNGDDRQRPRRQACTLIVRDDLEAWLTSGYSQRVNQRAPRPLIVDREAWLMSEYS